MWVAIGYRLLPTGEWYEPEESIGPSSEFVRLYPYGHVCKACRDHFRSAMYHDAFCQSCRDIMELDRRKIESILNAVSDKKPETERQALREIQIALECPRCWWQANGGRVEPTDIKLIREFAKDWIVAAHVHWMRHNFANRFPTKPKCVSKKEWKENAEMNKLFAALDKYAKKNPNVIEIAFSEDGIPLYAKQKLSKHVLQFPPA